MNRSFKKQQEARERGRSRRQGYLPLHVHDDDGDGRTPECFLLVLSEEPEEFVEKAVEPGDTLLSLSLQFNCPVAELKRVNHIIRDNEIFARRKIKVPIKPGSVLTENLARVHSNGGQNRSDEGTSTRFPGPDVERASSDPLTEGSVKSVPYFGTLNLKPIDILKSEGSLSVDHLVGNDDADDGIVSRPLLEEGTRAGVSNEVFKCSGDDWGLSWLQLVLFALLLGCAGPVLYILFIAERDKAA